MKLEFKSAENLGLVTECVRSGRYCTAAIGRAYYAVFQRMKSLLLRENFVAEDSDAFSHGTIKATVVAHLAATRPHLEPAQIAAKLAAVDQLYAARREADYEDGRQFMRAGLEGYRLLAESLVAYIDGVQKERRA